MKTIKKLLSMLLALMMISVMVLPAYAAAFSITINNSSTQLNMTGTTYSAYKVFDVTYAGSGSTAPHTYTTASTFSAFTYTVGGTTYNSTNLPTYVSTLATDSDALNAFATAVKTYITTKPITADGSIVATDSKTATIPLNTAGYYIIIATAKTTDGKDTTVTSLCELTTTDPTGEVQLKADVPTVTKQVKENSTNTYGKVADYQIGENVPFKITATIPTYADKYSSYTYVIHDTMDATLSLNTGTIKVYSDANLTDEILNPSNTVYTVNTATGNSETFTITLTPAYIKSNPGKTVYVGYTALLNKDALIYTDVNKNVHKNTVNLEYSNNPYASTTAKTPDTTVSVCTYQFEVFKYAKPGDTDETPLSGAQFKLYSDSACTNEVKLVSTTGTANSYRVGESAETGLAYVESSSTGQIFIKGLDEKTYYLKETVAPAGYNLLANAVAVKIVATKDQTSGTVTSVAVNDSNDPKVKVLNQTGAELPTTGGIGTTMFYVIGASLMLGAAVVLITKKRLTHKD